MALSITPLATSVSGTDLLAAETVAAGTYLVISTLYAFHASASPAPATVADVAGNVYSLAWAMATGDPGFPLPATYAGLVVNPIGVGDAFQFLGAPETSKAFKLAGADAFTFTPASAQVDGDPLGASGPSTAWSLPSLTVTGEHILIGQVASLDLTAFADHVTETAGAYVSSEEKQLFVPAGTPSPVVDEWFSALHLWQAVNPGGATAYTPAGSFDTAQKYWFGGHIVFSPVWFGEGRRLSLVRGPDGRLVGSFQGALQRDMEQSGATGGAPVSHARSVCVLYDRAGRLFHFSAEQGGTASDLTLSGTGGYTIRLCTSRDQGRNFDAGQTLFSPNATPSDGVGYQAVEAALDAKSGLLLVMLYDHLGRRWLSSVGKLNSTRTAWILSAPVERVTHAGPNAHLIYLDTGRFRFAYVAEGSFVANLSSSSTWHRITNGDALAFVEVDGLTAAGAGNWKPAVTAFTGPTPVGAYPATASPSVFTMLDGANQLRSGARGLYLLQYHVEEATLTDHTLPAYALTSYVIPGTLGSDGETWSWGTPVLIGAVPSQRGNAFNCRRDSVWRWFKEGAGGTTSLLKASPLGSDASGVWS